MLYSSKCNISEDFKTDMNIMYRIIKNIASEEEEIEVIIFNDSRNKSIFKLFDSKIIISSMKIV